MAVLPVAVKAGAQLNLLGSNFAYASGNVRVKISIIINHRATHYSLARIEAHNLIIGDVYGRCCCFNNKINEAMWREADNGRSASRIVSSSILNRITAHFFEASKSLEIGP